MVVPEAGPELSVVCKNCGSEVSPYVTECPYCGTRLRKRAPKLERRGDELTPRESRRARRRRRAAERRAPRVARARSSLADRAPLRDDRGDPRPGAPAARPARRRPHARPGRGRSSAPPRHATAWHYLAAPFVYDDLGYLFAIGLALVLFVPGLERRLGPIADRAPAARLRARSGRSPRPALDDAVRRRRHARRRRQRRSRSGRWAPGSCSAAPRRSRDPTGELDWIAVDGGGLRAAAPAAGRRATPTRGAAIVGGAGRPGRRLRRPRRAPPSA